MHFIIINASPHTVSQSNTAQVIESFQQGIKQTNSTYKTYHLSKKIDWENAIKDFVISENIIIALPVFAATIPGYLMQFFEELYKYKLDNPIPSSKNNISFIIQSGFPEACQRYHCENLLRKISQILDCNYNGALSFGINIRFITNKNWQNILETYKSLGNQFVKNNGTFFFEEAYEQNKPEYFSEEECNKFNKIFNFFCRQISESRGCKHSLKYQPYVHPTEHT